MPHHYASEIACDVENNLRAPKKVGDTVSGWIVDIYTESEITKHWYEVQLTHRVLVSTQAKVRATVKRFAPNITNWEKEEEEAVLQKLKDWDPKDDNKTFTINGTEMQGGQQYIEIKPHTWTCSLQWEI